MGWPHSVMVQGPSAEKCPEMSGKLQGCTVSLICQRCLVLASISNGKCIVPVCMRAWFQTLQNLNQIRQSP